MNKESNIGMRTPTSTDDNTYIDLIDECENLISLINFKTDFIREEMVIEQECIANSTQLGRRLERLKEKLSRIVKEIVI